MSWSRAVPGHTQQAHTREFYMLCQPRDLLYTSCMAVWEDGSHFSAYVRTKKKKKLYQARHKSQPPTYQTRHIRLRHLLEKPNPQPLSLPSVLQLPLLSLSFTTPLLCLPSPSLPGGGLMSWEPEEDERGKAGMLRPREAIGLTPRYLKQEISHWHCDKDPNQPGPPMKASGMISCSREAAKNRNACVWKTAWRWGGGCSEKVRQQEMTTKNM